MKRTSILVLCLFAPAGLASAQSLACNRSPELEAALKPLSQPLLDYETRTALRRSIAESVLARFPDEFLAHWAAIGDLKRPEIAGRAATITRYQQYAAAHAGPAAQVLLARALTDSDTPRAIALFEQHAAAVAWAHVALADIYGYGRFADRAKARTHIAAFFDACPDSTSGEALNRLSSLATPEIAAKYAAGLRTLAAATAMPAAASLWRTLWELEFKARPAPEHAALRKTILADATRLESQLDLAAEANFSVVNAGYQQSGDAEALARFEDRVIAQAPASELAIRIGDARYRKANPFPQPSDPPEKKRAYYRANLARAQKTLEINPQSLGAILARFYSLIELDDADPASLLEAGEAAIELIRRGLVSTMPPTQFTLARALVKRKFALDRVPALLEAGLSKPLQARNQASDRDTDEVHKMEDESGRYLKIAYAEALLDYAAAKADPSLARDAVAGAEAAATPKPPIQAQVLTLKARFAELDKRNLDALLLYRAALDIRPKPAPNAPDTLAQAYDRVFKQIGGTAIAGDLLARSSKPKAESSTDGRWEKPAKSMAPWQLTDLQGATWKLTQFEGKSLLINVWATWCGPCRTEHPHFQKLYERLKDRPDVRVLSFNIDDSIGLVEPYMKDGKYSFPVLMAKAYVEELLPLISIPRNWVVSAKGEWQWEQIGFGNADGWEQMMLDKLAAAK